MRTSVIAFRVFIRAKTFNYIFAPSPGIAGIEIPVPVSGTQVTRETKRGTRHTQSRSPKHCTKSVINTKANEAKFPTEENSGKSRIGANKRDRWAPECENKNGVSRKEMSHLKNILFYIRGLFR